MFENSIDKSEQTFYTNNDKNKKTHTGHTNGAGTPLIRTGLLVHTNSMPKRLEFEAQNCTCTYCT